MSGEADKARWRVQDKRRYSKIMVQKFKQYYDYMMKKDLIKSMKTVVPRIRRLIKQDRMGLRGEVEMYLTYPEFSNKAMAAMKNNLSIKDNWLRDNGVGSDFAIQKNAIDKGDYIASALFCYHVLEGLDQDNLSRSYAEDAPTRYLAKPDCIRWGKTDFCGWYISDRIYNNDYMKLISKVPKQLPGTGYLNECNIEFDEIALCTCHLTKVSEVTLNGTYDALASNESYNILTPIFMAGLESSSIKFLGAPDDFDADRIGDNANKNVEISETLDDTSALLGYTAFFSSWDTSTEPPVIGKSTLSPSRTKTSDTDVLFGYRIDFSEA